MQRDSEIVLSRTEPRRRLRILTWHVHGNYLYYLSQAPHDFYVPVECDESGRARPGHSPLGGRLPWDANVHQIARRDVHELALDCVIYQSHENWLRDRFETLSPAQRSLPSICIEHDPPCNHPTDQPHPVNDANALLVHVTHFNALMWQSGATPVRVIEHGVKVPSEARYTGELEEGIVVINHLAQRGRRLGADVYEQMRERVPLSLVGMDSHRSPGGLGEIPNSELAGFIAHYRFFFNPIRWTSLGLAVIEAMMIGMPIVGLATTEMSTVVANGVTGWVDTDPERLVAVMLDLLEDPDMARRWGQAARTTAHARFGIERFVADWNDALALVTG